MGHLAKTATAINAFAVAAFEEEAQKEPAFQASSPIKLSRAIRSAGWLIFLELVQP
jgi:hypothetical protein